jgi:hypothetical protein
MPGCIIDQVRTLMFQSVTIEPYVSDDVHGQAVYDTGVLYKSRVTYRPRKVVDFRGEDIVSSVQVRFADQIVVDPRSRITLPNGSQPVILSIVRSPCDQPNHYHTMVMC